jgi:hypothetical protein
MKNRNKSNNQSKHHEQKLGRNVFLSTCVNAFPNKTDHCSNQKNYKLTGDSELSMNVGSCALHKLHLQ